jgi:uncharacterized lipoprotein
MRTIQTCTLVLFASVATGCAFTPQAIELQPKLNVTESCIGNGRAVFVNVVDERTRKTLGTRGPGVGADLTLKGNPRSIVRASISGGLARKGYAPTTETVADAPELRVQIRDLDYEVRSGFWAGSLRTECNLKAICMHGRVNRYQSLYTGKFESSIRWCRAKNETIGL